MSQIQQIADLLRSLTEAPGVSGQENAAAAVAAQILSQYMPVRRDALGNVIGEQAGQGPHILLDAHTDQIGMVVTAVDGDGFLKLASVGASDARVMAASEVTVWGKEPLYGVITSLPPHLTRPEDKGKAKDFTDLAVDIGFSKERAEALVQPGDRVSLRSCFLPLAGDRVSGTAFDDRAGVAVLLRCVELLHEIDYKGRLSVLFSVQEEIGGSGAATGGFALATSGDAVDEALAVDVSFAFAPGIPKESCGELGKGPMIGFAPVLDAAISRALENCAKERGLPYQLEVMGGKTSTNADLLQIAGRGIRSGLLSVPLRNMHTGVEILDLKDLENTAKLLAVYIQEKGANHA